MSLKNCNRHQHSHMFYNKVYENGRYVLVRKPVNVNASSKSDTSTCFPTIFLLVHSPHVKPNYATIQAYFFHHDSHREEQRRWRIVPLPFPRYKSIQQVLPLSCQINYPGLTQAATHPHSLPHLPTIPPSAANPPHITNHNPQHKHTPHPSKRANLHPAKTFFRTIPPFTSTTNFPASQSNTPHNTTPTPTPQPLQ